MSNKLVHILRAGKMSYQDSLNLQKAVSTHLIKTDDKYKNFLILTEHEPVYTLGLRTKNYSIDDEEKLTKLGAQFFKTNRGGLITFHGAGQLVAYPILNLKNFQPSVRWYVCHVEKTIVDLCQKYGIKANTTQDTGVWVEDRKICAIGIHASRYITTHGLALNCNIDLSWFSHIVPCGLEGKEVTSLTKELSKNTSIDDVTPKFIESFRNIFECSTEDMSQEQINQFLIQT